MEQPMWMKDPAVKDIAPEKLQFLQSLFSETKGLSKKEMIPFLMKVMKQAKEKNIRFENAELQLLINTIKKYSSEEELETIQKMMSAKPPHH